MNTSIKKYNDLLIIGLILIIPAIHEFGHFLGYVIDGVEVTFTYAFTFSERQTMLGVLGGPLINIIISILAIALIYIDNKHKGLWGIIGLVSIVSRFVNCFIVFLIGIVYNISILENNDEGQLSTFIGTNTIFQYVLSIGIYTILMLIIIRLIKDNKMVLKIIAYTLILSLIIILSQFF